MSGSLQSLARVKTRVNVGGHDVPVEAILRRYGQSMNNFVKIAPLADRLFIFDNSGKKHRSIVTIKSRQVSYRSKRLPEWYKNFPLSAWSDTPRKSETPNKAEVANKTEPLNQTNTPSSPVTHNQAEPLQHTHTPASKAEALKQTHSSNKVAKSISAQEREDFIKANVLWILYYEMAHALIHQLDLPVLGKKEDAADQLAILLSDELWDEGEADLINSYASSLFWLAGETALEQSPWWDEHSTDQQRHFSIACLYFGGDPDKRAHVLEAVGLPEDRAEVCIEERELLDRSWGEVLDKLTDKSFKNKFIFKQNGKLKNQSQTASFVAQVLEAEVNALNEHFSLPEPLSVVVMQCEEENAFYAPQKSEIQICSEYADFLDRLYKSDGKKE